MKEWNISHILLPVSLSASVMLAGGLCHETERSRRLKAYCRGLHLQNEYLRERRRELERQHRQLRRMRHEMINEYILELGYLERGLYRQLEQHYRKKTGYFHGNGRLIDTGNVGMDAVLSSKIKEAAKQRIEVEFEHQITGRIGIDDGDMSILLGNLIDNAMEAAGQTAERKIMLWIRTDAAAFFLEINNPYQGARKKNKRGDYETRKADHELHGIGLWQVKRIARKYGGRVLIQDKDQHFDVKVLLYMRDNSANP